ncbi:hypothetical protein CC85DRAFT_289396 [Cutaneotrichosporon oleaginosum]|uniref:Uncharacterized protein n=1 Tax=Cutaneotrichosporon oleaginosum TaxID=879819 RepID=A0A0J0XBZ5_9TREE|nr:uncharacterized protein CC85DRAFT_289396 [Cutaneotrichosporon oleaginosum]KLT38580.1 hypothetical protein CC85DRAFT_289396 [Cutaneotrichosporon oleaginosum]TXT08465.1 hypothetical protein COLE_05389 [Cutaneotrichosporon oleaginosum]
MTALLLWRKRRSHPHYRVVPRGASSRALAGRHRHSRSTCEGITYFSDTAPRGVQGVAYART